MTQDQLRLLSGLSIGCLALLVFELPTLICLLFVFYFTYLYLKSVIKMHISRGLIELCPERLKNQLLNRSIFDFVCSLWFKDWFIFLKKFFQILFKPLVQPIDQENPVEALQDMDEETKRVYLRKGVVRAMPAICQQVLLGNERAQEERLKTQEEEKARTKMLQEGSSEMYTRDRSHEEEPKRLIRVNSESQINNCAPLKEERWSGDNSERKLVPVKKRGQELLLSRTKKQKPKGLIHTLNNSMSMLKKIVEMQNIGGNVQKMNSATIIKVMCVFWLALLLQLKMNAKARKSVIRMFYVMGSMVTVMGIVSTSGVLIYKEWNKRKRNSQIEELEHEH